MASSKKSDRPDVSSEPEDEIAFDVFGQAGRQPDTQADLLENIEAIEMYRELNEDERALRRQLQKDRETRDNRIHAIRQVHKARKAQ